MKQALIGLLACLIWAGALLIRVGANGQTTSTAAVTAHVSAPSVRLAAQDVTSPPAGSTAPQPLIDFERQIKPILTETCLECHSQDKRKGGLSLASYVDVLDGGRSGAVIRPGDGARSLLLQRITGEIEPQMPRDELPLGPEQIALIRLWIDQGARATPAAPPAPQPWEAPLALERPNVPDARWSAWTSPVDRFVSQYLAGRGAAEPLLVEDAAFARRAYLDVWGLLPSPEQMRTFLADGSSDKRTRLVETLLADSDKYAEHWITFWNDLLRNEDGVTYFSENASRKSITDWLLASLRSNVPYDQFVGKLLNPTAATDPEGFLVGVNWRGETSAAVTPWMQASQNTAQIFLGVNLKCNACHDSFINKWKLKDAYALAGFFSPEPRLQMYRCDVAQEQFAEPAFLYPELNRVPPSSALADRRATAAAIFTDPRNGRLPRTLVNRFWQRLLGHGIVPNSDEMDGKPWNPALLDWLAADFVEHGYDMKRLLATILSSRTYQMPAVRREGEPPARDYAFAGPEVRRMTAEQFSDAVGAISGEWSVHRGTYVRDWRAASTDLTRALGRPIRDQVISMRASQPTTPQALELVNGELLTARLALGARRMLGRLPPAPVSLFNKTVAGRNAAASPFDIDVSNATRLWLIVAEEGSNAPERVLPAWLQAEFTGPDGATPLASLKPVDASGLRGTPAASTVAVKNPSHLVYDIRGRGFSRFRGTIGLENARSEIGATLNPAVRFYVFDAQPDMERLSPPTGEGPLPTAPALTNVTETVDRVFWHALGRAPSPDERRVASAALDDGRGRVSSEGLADLLWALMMKPEFQFIS
ncbi:MAG TPA: PSD1 and planctomycete cytochrome C domain-containing protein [Vicinamibacterales bacterium]|nr:PSD1 and planctomycete cytochrome C domain-containing protein [Vicinamibacterales bacterium]